MGLFWALFVLLSKFAPYILGVTRELSFDDSKYMLIRRAEARTEYLSGIVVRHIFLCVLPTSVEPLETLPSG